jgi:pre-mRNA-splicing factor 38A
MANQTDESAIKVHGADAQVLIDRIARESIYQSRYWKEFCFGVCAADVVALAAEITHVGGLCGHARRPTPFLCLVLKLLQLGPSRDVIDEFLYQSYFKYAKVLGATYLRLVGSAVDIYENLEPHYADYRKIVLRSGTGDYQLTTVDQIIDDLLVDEQVFGVTLPRLQHRYVLSDLGHLQPRRTTLLDEDSET